MNKLWFVPIFTLLSITTTATRRSVDAWPKEFNVKKLPNWENMYKCFSIVRNSSRDESYIRVPIQRRHYATRYKNGSESRDNSVMFAPLMVFLNEESRGVRWGGIVHMVLTFLLTLVFIILMLYFGLGKLSTQVYVRNLYDENKPIREMWCAVTLQFRGKKREKTPIQTQPFERIVEEEKASKHEKK